MRPHPLPHSQDEPTNSLPGRTIAEIFEEKIPNIGENDEGGRYLVSPELIAYLQWLIYSAQYKAQDQGARGEEHKKYYNIWLVSFKAKLGLYCKKLLKELERAFAGDDES